MIDKKFKGKAVQAALTELVIDNYNERKERSLLEKKWTTFYNLYRGIDTKGTYRGRANLDWASAFLIVEILTPRIYNALFPRMKWYDIIGVEPSDDKQAQIISAYLLQKFERDIQFKRKMISMCRYCCIYGTVIAKTPYRKEKKSIPKRVKKKLSNLYGRIEFALETEEIFTFDSIDLQLVDLYDFYPADDFIDNIEDQPFIIHKSVEYTDLLYKKEWDKNSGTGIYENLDKINFDISKNSADNVHKTFRKSMLGYTTRGYGSKSMDFIEYQGVYEGEDIIVIIAQDGELNPIVSAEVLNTPDKEKTFLMAKWLDIPNEFFGMSLIERVEKPIYEVNDRVNQTMDITGQIINPMWLNTDADIHEGTLRIFPGRIISSSTDKGLTPLHPPVEILAPAYKAIQALMSAIQDISGATRFLGGSAQTPELQRTATGILSIIKEANMRLRLVIIGFENRFILRWLRRSYKYAQFYAERKEIVRIVGKQGIEYQTVDPAAILGDYDFKPLGSQSIGSEELMTQQMINYLNIISRIPGVLQNFDVIKLAAKIGERMLGLDDIDELILVNNRENEEREKATSENMAAMEGIPPVLSANDNHKLHLEIHQGFLLDERAEEFPKAIELLTVHNEDHKSHEKGQGMMPVYNQGNKPTSGIPPQKMPDATSEKGLTQQMAQPSQEGTQ